MKHNLISAALATTLLISAQPEVFAQARKLSMEEAIQLSIQNSGQLKIANAKVDEAKANYREMWNNHLPDVKVTGAYMRLNSPDVALKVKTGGTSTDTASKAPSMEVNQVAYGMVNAALPLFSGLRIKYGVESMKYLEQAARLDAERDKEEVIQNTINAYSNLYKAQSSVVLIEENLKQQKQRVADFSNLEKNGLMARNDLLKAQLQQSNIELALLDAQNNLKMTYINMALMLGLSGDTEIVADTAGFATLADAGTIARWEQTAQENRKDKASLGYQEKAANAAVRSTKGEYYPGIALTGGYIAADIPNLLTITNAVNVGLGVSYNIAALWKTGTKVAQHTARLHQLQAMQGILSDRIRLEVNQAYRNYMLSLQKIEVYARAIEQANENYRITRNKYDNNLVTTTELLEADVAQLQARLNYAFSRTDAVVAYKKLQQTAGVLTDK